MAEENAPEQEKKSNKPLIFIIIGVVVFLILIAVLVFVLFMRGDNHEEVAPEQKTQKTSTYSSKNVNLLNIGPLYAIDKPFVVNLITQNGRRYLKTSITLELSNPKLQQEVEQKSSAIKDIIIDTLSSKSIEEVITTKSKEKIKNEILEKINAILADGEIKNVFFTEFIVQ